MYTTSNWRDVEMFTSTPSRILHNNNIIRHDTIRHNNKNNNNNNNNNTNKNNTNKNNNDTNDDHSSSNNNKNNNAIRYVIIIRHMTIKMRGESNK